MLLISPDGDEAKERVKWEAHPTAFGPPGRPYVYQAYPKMLYRAGRNPSGVPTIIDSYVVESETQEANLKSRGYCEGQDAALAYLHAADQEAAVLAANRAYSDRSMSPQAQAEAAAIDSRSSSHLPVIPEQPRKPRRKPGPKPRSEAT